MILRLLAAYIIALCCAMPGWAFDLPEGFEAIGEFTVEINGEPAKFTSIGNADEEDSDLTVYTDFGITTYQFVGWAGNNANGEPSMPILELGLQIGGLTNDLAVISVTLFDQDYQRPLLAFHEERGEISSDILILSENGEVSLTFSADLVRVDLETEQPIPNESGAHIEGVFGGTIPAHEWRK